MSTSRHVSPFPIQLPPRVPSEPAPQWTGRGFTIGPKRCAIAEYSSDESGWDDALTAVHEEASGTSHPIDVASRDVALLGLKKYFRNKTGTILEIGCSSGYLLPLIRRQFPTASVVGADVVKQPLLRLAARFPDLPLLRFDVTRCPLPNGCVDAVVMLNVLEHIGDEVAALSQLRRILKPGGIVVLEVPAGPHLYDYYDEYLRHYRRYNRTAVSAAARAAGLQVIECSHLGFWLYPAFWAAKKFNRTRGPNKEQAARLVKKQISSSASSRIVAGLMGLETFMADRFHFRYPIGIRCTAVLQRA